MCKYYLYTDGSCRKNGSSAAVGAWGYVIWDEQKENTLCSCAQVEHNTTNQRMELMAAIEGCTAAYKLITNPFDEVHLYTDSAYLHNCINQKWYEKWRINGWINSKKETVANRDLWEQLIEFFEDPQIIFHKTKAHCDDKYNNYIDFIVQTLTEIEVKTNGSYN